MLGEGMDLARWLETQSPLWVIYAIVIVGLVRIGQLFFRWAPLAFEKHCVMLDTATKSMADSANVITGINGNIGTNRVQMKHGQEAISDAAVPACKAILVITPVDKREEVKGHLDEVVRILGKPTREPR